ncbi:hypothetical protein [Actinomadura algeriensis]|uniref:Uncharacterized protein n=1 Tax=Actinomadura algeriensis TaxID=1679523 RepID=A0ABR9JP54_9ACTN|nr:hypothetical protein [Actinomadura algeriensis]MBE1532288.1 hypothetical protein [Actinomadura algeriensis]
MPERTVSGDPLAALGAHLSAHRFTVELTARGLRVVNPRADERDNLTELIQCRPRQDDGGRAWFWTSRNEPIAEADRITDAVVIVKGRLTARSDAEGAGR